MSADDAPTGAVGAIACGCHESHGCAEAVCVATFGKDARWVKCACVWCSKIVLYVYRPIESVTATHSQLVRAFVREGHGVPASRPYSKWLKGIGGNVAEV
jgi:hypothetical protein